MLDFTSGDMLDFSSRDTVGELPETGLMVISNFGVIAVWVKFTKLFRLVVFRCHQN